jgi:maltooligosyltrehalose trehalohydrolase
MGEVTPQDRSAERTLLRRLPVGAEPQPGGVHFRVWAPAARAVALELEGQPPRALSAEPDGYFSALVAEADAGTRYRFRLDRQENAFPDPASRFQPEGPHGSSEVVDPARFAWSDGD